MSIEHQWRRREWMILTSALTAAGLLPRESLAADLDETTVERLKLLQTCDRITADFRYFGDQDKPFYEVTYVYGKEPAAKGENSFHRRTNLDRETMLKLLDALAKDGFIGAARDISTKDIKAPIGYNLTLTANKTGAGDEFKKLGWQSVRGDGHVELFQGLGWDLRMIERLEKLQPALAGEAAKDMQFLLTRLTGLKAEWQRAAGR